MSADVIIVGGGAAGLMAARELAKAGKRVLVIEARKRLGGRIYPLPEEEWGYPAQAGAEFVHGDAPLTKALVHEAGATLTHPTEWWNVYDGEPTVEESVPPHDPMLEGALKELGADMTVLQFLDTYFPGEPARPNGRSGGEHAALRQYVIRRVEAYDAADPKRASARALLEDLTDERGWIATNIKEGYGALVSRLESVCRSEGVQFDLSEEVTAIDVRDADVSVVTKGNACYVARYAIVTVPLPLIKEIRFNPAIPEKFEAAAQIGYGNVTKILLRFREKWWSGARERNFEKLFFMFSNETIPTWWTQYPEPHTTLTGWVAGPSADRLSSATAEEVVALALTSLSHIFKVSMPELELGLTMHKVFQWGNDPFARGAYSYCTPETADAIQTLLVPVAGRVFFAGEALYAGEGAGVVGGTVEAALASGHAAAQSIRSF